MAYTPGHFFTPGVNVCPAMTFEMTCTDPGRVPGPRHLFVRLFVWPACGGPARETGLPCSGYSSSLLNILSCSGTSFG